MSETLDELDADIDRFHDWWAERSEHNACEVRRLPLTPHSKTPAGQTTRTVPTRPPASRGPAW